MAKMPKRRKDKYNPYTLGFDEETQTYTVEFVDNLKVIHKLNIPVELYQAFNEFELQDISQMHKYDRHIEHLEVDEEDLYKRGIHKEDSIEDIIIKKSIFEDLKNAIELLPDTQKRRIKKYYFQDKNEYQIALEENATQQAVNKSLNLAREKLKELLKK